MWLNNVILEDRLIERERLDLSAKDANYYLGPSLTLRHCTLALRVPARQLHLAGPKLLDCVLEVKRELTNLPWYTAFLKGCRFIGRLKGNDFGHLPDPVLPHRDAGGIEDCDFTAAQLDGCRFVGCDVRTLRLPRWPCFTILEPQRRSVELNACAWPGEVGFLVKGFSMYPQTTAAVTFSAHALAKDWRTTEDEIKAMLTKIDGVQY